jgi:acyl-CoA synthetase (AMP-forming)/AMP-acid ligase II
MGVRDRIDFARGRAATLGEFLDHLAQIHGDGCAVEEDGYDGLRLTFTEAAACAASWAGALRARVDPGQPVVIALPNGYGLFVACVAAARAGCIAVPVNPKMRTEEVDHVVADSGAAIVVRDAGELDGADPVEAAPTDPGDVAALFYTSGTTGKPKGAELTHGALVGRVGPFALYPSGLRRDEAVSGLPVAHIAGFAMLIQLAALGIPVYLLRRFRPDAALNAIEQRRSTMFVGVPAMYRMMMEAGADDRDLRSVRLWASGADAMPVELARHFQGLGAAVSVLGRPVGRATFVDGYGMVELGGGAAIGVLPPTGGDQMLRVPLPGYRLRIVGDDGGPVARGDVGELVVKGPGVMRGYHGQTEATAEAMTPDGWLRTGDLARRGRIGLIEFAGRKKDVIKHGGYSVFAAEVEGALEEHADVAEAAVVGLPDDRKGEVPAAAVRLGFDCSISEEELVSWAEQRLSDYKVPRRILFVGDLPRTGTDKVRKQDVKALFDAG